MDRLDLPIHGRGASANPAIRFEPLHYLTEEAESAEEAPSPRTQFFRDHTRSVIATNDSPDVGFDASINPYRGCEHGCIYCYARPYHEYLGLSAGLDFESKIFVKEHAPELLRRELSSPSWQPRTLGVCGVTDCYQPIERHLRLTRRCLEVLAEFRNPAVVVTKNHTVTRDKDCLVELAKHSAALVCISITTLDASLCDVMEPRATRPAGRLDAMAELSEAGIPVAVLVAPVIPGLTDHEMPQILAAARNAGAVHASFVMLRLPYAVKDLFIEWLAQHFPERKEKVLGRIRSMRNGKLNESDFKNRMRGKGLFAEMTKQMFDLAKAKERFPGKPKLSAAAFRRPNETPPALFEV
jgi:DNA repair photolyase